VLEWVEYSETFFTVIAPVSILSSISGAVACFMELFDCEQRKKSNVSAEMAHWTAMYNWYETLILLMYINFIWNLSWLVNMHWDKYNSQTKLYQISQKNGSLWNNLYMTFIMHYINIYNFTSEKFRFEVY
jgi:hypothetical protein